jgi:hypothetical protein
MILAAEHRYQLHLIILHRKFTAISLMIRPMLVTAHRNDTDFKIK